MLSVKEHFSIRMTDVKIILRFQRKFLSFQREI